MEKKDICKEIHSVMEEIADIDFYDMSALKRKSNQRNITKAYFQLEELKKQLEKEIE